MAKFKITVIRTDEYEIECNWTDEEIKDWSKSFYPAKTQKDIAKLFAVDFMRNEDKYFIEGYGYVKEYREDGSLKKFFINDSKTGKLRELIEEEYSERISIRPISQSDNYETEIEKLHE